MFRFADFNAVLRRDNPTYERVLRSELHTVVEILRNGGANIHLGELAVEMKKVSKQKWQKYARTRHYLEREFPGLKDLLKSMSLNDDLWALAEDQRRRPRLPGVFPAFTRYIDVNRSLPTTGFCVAYSATQNHFGRDGLNRAVAHARSHDKIVGGWFNRDDGRFYFDSVRIYQNRETAIQAAIRERQIGIYDLSTGTYTDVMDQESGSFANKGSKRRFSI